MSTENIAFFLFRTDSVDNTPDEWIRPYSVFVAWDRARADGGAGHSCLVFFKSADDVNVLEANSSFPSHLFLFSDPAENRMYGPHHNGEGLAHDLSVVKLRGRVKLKSNYRKKMVKNNFRREDFDTDAEWREAFYDKAWRTAWKFNRHNSIYHEQHLIYKPTPDMRNGQPFDGFGNCNSFTGSVVRRIGAETPFFFTPIGWHHNCFVYKKTDTPPRLSGPLSAHYPFYNFIYIGSIPLKGAFPGTRSYPPVKIKSDYIPY